MEHARNRFIVGLQDQKALGGVTLIMTTVIDNSYAYKFLVPLKAQVHIYYRRGMFEGE